MPEGAEGLVLLSLPGLTEMDALFAEAGLQTVRRAELADSARADVRVLVYAGGGPLEPAFLESLPNLGLIACASVGYDGIDVPWCRARGIEVTHARGLNAEDVADHAMGLLVAAWRNIAFGDRYLREGRWTKTHRPRFGPSLQGRRLGIVGLGAIGAAAARRAEASGLVVSWWGPNARSAPWPRADSLMALAEQSDILLVACRATASNRGLISRAVIEAVGPEGLIVNVARGSLIAEDELIAALRDGRLGKAALDVFEEEPTPAPRWADVPNTVLTPHMAGGAREVVPMLFRAAADNARRFLAGEPVASPVPA